MFGPLLPFLSDGQASVDALFERAAECCVDVIWVDALNPRPRVWQSVAGLLRARFPDLLERYPGVLFNGGSRDGYLSEIRKRVASAAKRFGLAERVAGCP